MTNEDMSKKYQHQGQQKLPSGKLPQRMDAGQAAIAQVRARMKRDAEELEKATNSEADRVWFVGCDVCQGVALWFNGKPGPFMTSDSWYTAYKPLGTAWPTTVVHCQVCETSERKTLVKTKKYGGGRYNVLPRKIQSMPRAAYDALCEGDLDRYEELTRPPAPDSLTELILASNQKMPLLKDVTNG